MHTCGDSTAAAGVVLVLVAVQLVAHAERPAQAVLGTAGKKKSQPPSVRYLIHAHHYCLGPGTAWAGCRC